MLIDNLLLETLQRQRRQLNYVSSRNNFVEENKHILYEPELSLKSIRSLMDGVTYKKINDWESKGIFTFSRKEAETGWRVFSILICSNYVFYLS